MKNPNCYGCGNPTKFTCPCGCGQPLCETCRDEEDEMWRAMYVLYNDLHLRRAHRNRKEIKQ